jgi:hypothetical protein
MAVGGDISTMIISLPLSADAIVQLLTHPPRRTSRAGRVKSAHALSGPAQAGMPGIMSSETASGVFIARFLVRRALVT